MTQKFTMNSRTLMRKLADKNIQTRPLWQPVHLSKAHQGSYAVDCSVAERLNREAISLPCSVGLNASEQQQVIAFLMENGLAE